MQSAGSSESDLDPKYSMAMAKRSQSTSIWSDFTTRTF